MGGWFVHSEFSVLLWSKALVSDWRPGPSLTILMGFDTIEINLVLKESPNPGCAVLGPVQPQLVFTFINFST